jgi:hypothetical protein
LQRTLSIFVFLISLALGAQRTAQKNWLDLNITDLVVNVPWASNVLFTGTDNFSGIQMKYRSDGEYQNRTVLTSKVVGRTLYITESPTPNTPELNDKLSAHKFISTKIELMFSSNISFNLKSNDAKVNGKGKMKNINLDLKSGYCELSNWDAPGSVTTQNASVNVISEKTAVSGESKNGIVILPMTENGLLPFLKINSLNGNITHQKKL